MKPTVIRFTESQIALVMRIRTAISATSIAAAESAVETGRDEVRLEAGALDRAEIQRARRAD